MNVITLGNGNQIPIPDYVRGIKTAIENLGTTFDHGLTGWWPCSGREIRNQFFEMVQNHCNRGLTISPKSKDQVILKSWKQGRPVPCRYCGKIFIRKNPLNDNDRYCSTNCRSNYFI